MTLTNGNSIGRPDNAGRKSSVTMQLVKLAVCISVLVTKICFAELIIETSKLDESSLIETTIDVLESCYTDGSRASRFAVPSAGSITTNISSRCTVISVRVMDETSRIERHDPVDLGSQYKLEVFAMTISQRALVKTLDRIGRSKGLHHMSCFLLIDLPTAENGSSNVAGSLWVGWRTNVLDSKFFGPRRTKGQLTYTLNYHTSQASDPWQRKNTCKGRKGHIWTSFFWESRENESSGDGLDFGKTVDLSDHKVRSSVKGTENRWFPEANLRSWLMNRMQNVTPQILTRSVNATRKLVTETAKSGASIDGDTGQTCGATAKVTGGNNDLRFYIVYRHVFDPFETVYPLDEADIATLTRYSGHTSPLDKIISALDRSSPFGVLVALLITLFFFKIWLGRPLISAILDLVLTLSNAGLHKIPEKLAPRMYLCALFIFVVTIQGLQESLPQT